MSSSHSRAAPRSECYHVPGIVLPTVQTRATTKRYSRSDAFKQPMLSLLNQRQTPVVVAVLNTCFSLDTRMVLTARLHVMVEGLLPEMAPQALLMCPRGPVARCAALDMGTVAHQVYIAGRQRGLLADLARTASARFFDTIT